MFETLLDGTALPNLHPALVHFPIALAGVALVFDLVSLARQGEWRSSAVVLWWLAAGGGLAAYLAGEEAEESLGMLAPAAERAVGLHSDFAWWALLGLGAVALLRTGTILGWGGRPLAWLGVAAGLGVQPLILRTADLGGALVFQHAVAVTHVPQRNPEPERAKLATEPRPSPPPDLVRVADGSWTWTPIPGDVTALGRVLELSGAGALEVQVLPGGPGLRLRATGEGSLLLPERFGDVRVEGDLDVAGFDGTVGLGVLALEQEDGLTLERESTGDLALVRSRQGAREMLDQGTPAPQEGSIQLALSAIGGHWKGYQFDRSLVHAHGSLSGALRPVLTLRGNGELSLLSFRVTSMADLQE